MPVADRLALILMAAALSVAMPARAHDGDHDWQSLPPEHREALEDFRDRWQQMPLERREHLMQRAERWRQMPPEQREAIRRRWQEVRQMPPEAREAMRQRWQSMSPEERQQAIQSWHPRPDQ